MQTIRTQGMGLVAFAGLLVFNVYLHAEEGPVGRVDAVTNQVKRLRDDGQETEAEKLLASALEEFQALVKANPKQANPLIGLALVQYAQQNQPDAEKSLRDALRCEPKSKLALGRLALLLAQSKRMDEADPLYRQAIELFPKDDDLHREYAVALVAAGKLDDGEAQLQAAMELDARDPSSILFKAMLLLKRQKFDEAVGTLRAGIELNPKDIKLRDLLVFVLHGAKVYSEAYAEQLELRKLQPESIDVEEKLIVYASKMRRSDLAERHIAKLRELQIAQNKQEDSFARDEFWIGKQRVIVAEHFEMKGDPGYKFEFFVCDEMNREKFQVLLLTTAETTEHFRKQGQIGESEHAYVLAKQTGEVTKTIRIFKSVPTYDAVRMLAIEMIESDDKSAKQPPAPSPPDAENAQQPASK